MNNQEQFDGFTYNTKCTIWRISYLNKDKEYHIKNYYSDDYNIVSFNNSIIYSGICINQLNRFYGELCTMYYVWKNNLKSDIVGFDHYRRQWNNIDFNKINENKIQVYTYWNESKPILKGNLPNDIGCFLYSFISYIKFHYPEYSNKINYLLYKYPEIQNHVNIFVCKWNIFDKICQIIFGYLDNIMPNNQWQNSDKINEYIYFVTNYHKCINFDNNATIYCNDIRHINYCFENILGTLYNIISESFKYGNLCKYYILYKCNNLNDYNNILNNYFKNIGIGIDYILVYCNDILYNIFKNNKAKQYEQLNLVYKTENINWDNASYFGPANNNFINEYIIKNYIKIELNSNEYIYADNSIELNKGNYIIKTI